MKKHKAKLALVSCVLVFTGQYAHSQQKAATSGVQVHMVITPMRRCGMMLSFRVFSNKM
jgi:hypothetical protein